MRNKKEVREKVRKILRVLFCLLWSVALGETLYSVQVTPSTTTVKSSSLLDEKSKEFRDRMGFLKNPEHVAKAKEESKKNSSLQEFYTELTDEELKEVKFRNEVSRENGDAIRSAAERGEIDGFGGSYMDQKSGNMYVAIVGDNESSREKVLEKVPFKNNVRFYKAEFTLKELQLQKEKLSKSIESLVKQGLKFNDYGVSEEENKIEVNLPNDKEKNKDLITSIVEEKYLIFRVTPPWEYK